MGLVTVVQQQEIFNHTFQNKACTQTEVLDITGDYDVTTNPTGYGFPNFAASGVNNVVARIKQPGSNAYVDYTFDTTTTPTAIDIVSAVANTPINSFILGETTVSDLAALPDGVWDYIQIPFFANALFLTFTNNLLTGTGAGLTSDPASGMNYIKVGTDIYGITITSATTFTLDKVFAGTTGAHLVQQGYGANIKLLTSCQNDSCIARKNGEIATLKCGCNDTARNEFMKFDAILTGAKDLFFCEAYSQSQEAMDMVTNYCSGTGCDCS